MGINFYNLQKSVWLRKLISLGFLSAFESLGGKTGRIVEMEKPNDALKEVIKKVHRQKEHILTFIKHEGARAYACIQSIAMTCQLRDLSFHQFLKASLVCYIRTGKAMLLAEYESGLNSEARAA